MPESGIDVSGSVVVAFSCPVCRMISYHPEDVARGYCGNCHAFTRYLAETAGLLNDMGIAGAAMMAPDGPGARLHNALVRLANDVERSALEAARLVASVAVLADLEAADEMRWVPGCPEW